MDIMNLAAKISLDSKGFESGLKSSESKFAAFGNKLSAWTIAKGQLIAGFAKKAASTVGNFVSGSIQEGASFDTAMSQVAATMGKTMTEMADEVGTAQYKVDGQMRQFSGNLEEFARFMGANTKFTATEAAEALNYMALAGYNTQQSMDMLPNVLNLASAGAMDLAKASDMVTDTQTAFGINADRTTQMVDEMAKAASTGNTSVEQLGDAFLVVGALARELSGGMVTLADGTEQPTDRIQEMEIALTALANAGIKGSEAGTHMRNMLLKLSDPTKDGAKALKALGVEVFDDAGEMRSLGDIFTDLNKSMGSLTKEAKLEAIGDLFNTRDTASVEALLAAIENGDWDRIGESILNAEGAAQQMADTQLDNLAGDTKKWQSALSDFRIEISKRVSPTLRSFVQTGTKSIGRFTEAFKKGGWKAAKEELKNIFNDTIEEWKNSENPFMQKMGEILEKVKNAVGTMSLAFTDFPAFMKKAWEGIKNAAANLGGLIFGKNDQGDVNFPTWDDVKNFAKEKWEDIKSAAAVIGTEFGKLIFGENEKGEVNFPSWDDVVEFAKEKWEEIKTGALAIADEAGALIFGRNEDGSVHFPTWDEVKLIAQEKWEEIKAGAAKLSGLVFGDLEQGETVFTKIAEAWKQLRSTIEQGAIKVATYFFGDADPTTVSNAIHTIGDVLTSLGAGVLTYLMVQRFTSIIDSIKSLFSLGSTSKTGIILAAIATAITLIAQNWDQIEPILSAVGAWINENIVEPFQNAVEWLKVAVTEVKRLLGMRIDGELTQEDAGQLKMAYGSVLNGNPDQFYEGLRKKMSDAGYSAEQIEAAVKAIGEHPDVLWVYSFLDALTNSSTAAEALKDYIAEMPTDKTVTVHVELDDPDNALGVVREHHTPSSMGHLPGFAKGDWNVPYDMPAMLHQGEAVLTRSQARAYREGNSGTDLSGLEDRIAAAIKAGMKDVTVNSYLNGRRMNDELNRENMKGVKARRFST